MNTPTTSGRGEALGEYRPATEADIAETAGVFLAAVADMYARNGIAAPLPERRAVETGYRHVLRTGIFHVAEVGGRVGAICHAVVRGPLWFLSGFWALPELQRARLGGTLLRRVREEGAARGASTFFTWSSVDLTAMAAYMKAGMLPGYQVLTFNGPVPELPPADGGLELRPLPISSAADLDERVRAARREVDHHFWHADAGARGRLLLKGGREVGYFYLNRGVVGPAAWTDELGADELLRAACREAADEAGEVRLMVPGINHAAVRFALAHGLRLVSFSHLLTSAPFGRLERYLPSGPLLF